MSYGKIKTTQYIKLMKKIDIINKQLDLGNRKYSVKKHIKSKTRNNIDIYGSMKEKKYKNDSQYAFLLDNTGSMTGRGTSLQSTYLKNMVTAIQKLNKKCCVYGFTSTKEAYDTDTDCVRHNEFLSINSMLKKQKINIDTLIENIQSVNYAAQREFANIQLLYDDLLDYKIKHKVSNRINIIMFSDGGCTGQHSLLKAVINNINRNSEKTNIYLYIINVFNNSRDVYGKISGVVFNERDCLKLFKKLIKETEVL